MPFTLLSREDWKVSLIMSINDGDWFLQFESTNGDMFSWKIDKNSPEGSHFHSWIGKHYPFVIQKAMDQLW